MSRPPCESHCESELFGQPVIPKPVAERQHRGAGGESGSDDEIVVRSLGAPHFGGDYPRGDLEKEHVDTKTVFRSPPERAGCARLRKRPQRR
jgi:hypothetical protein